MGKEGLPREGLIGIHEIALGNSFKPYERMRSWYQTERDKSGIVVPEGYDHYLYLRKPVSLYGMPGAVDLVSEDPLNAVNIMALMARRFRFFHEHPFGHVESTVKFKENMKWERVEGPAHLRVSFSIKTPSDYAKLLCTYADVDLGKEKFLLVFNVNQLALKARMQALEKGEPVIVKEDNLFSYKTLENLTEEVEADHTDGDAAENKKPEGDPGRIGFVDIPIDLKTFRGIRMTFRRLWEGGEVEYPKQPIFPNQKLLPVLV